MKVFYSLIIFILIALVIVTINLRRESTNFYGIAETKEMVLNAELGVEIKEMRITPGQTVTVGDTLIELKSPEIDLKISEFTHLIDEMKTRSKVQANLSKSEMRQLKTEHESRIIEIHSELQQLQSQYDINRRLMKQLRSIDYQGGKANTDDSNPTLIKIENLKKELTRLENSNSIMDDNLSSQLSFGVDPLKEQLKQYEDLLRLYKEQKQKLFIVAPNDGIVGAVFFKKGEMVSAFDSIATLHSKSPSFIQGYIHENIYTSVSIGQKVLIQSLAEKKNEVIGEVVGVGTRIVEYPVRLRKVQDLQMWGREVTIKIPSNTKFLLGEKVMISILDEQNHSVNGLMGLFKSKAQAETREDSVLPVQIPVIHEISWADKFKSALGIEASGVQYLADINKYCVISDESPNLYLMDSDGTISQEILIEDLPKIDDLEGITADDSGFIYIACSQNPNKKGIIPVSRRFLIRLKRDKEKFKVDGKIKLIDALTQAAKTADSIPMWTSLIKVDIEKRTPDIEGITWKQDCLYISFKDPLLDGKSAILKINDISSCFISNTIRSTDVQLWKLLPLQGEASAVTYHISDIQFINNDLYILSNCSIDNNGIETVVGRLWVLRNNNEVPEIVKDFPTMKPEGLAYDNKILFVTFDNGSNQLSQFTTIKR